MNKWTSQICLKTADGALYPLFNDFSSKEIKLTIVTAREQQDKVVLEFMLKVIKDEVHIHPLARLELKDLPVSEGKQTTLYLNAEIDIVENLFLSVEDPDSGISDSAEIVLSEYLEEIIPEEKAQIPEQKRHSPVLTALLLSAFLVIAGGVSLLSIYLIGNKLSSDPPPPLTTFLYDNGSSNEKYIL